MSEKENRECTQYVQQKLPIAIATGIAGTAGQDSSRTAEARTLAINFDMKFDIQ